MKIAKGLGDFFGLDIGTNAVRVVQLARTSNGWNLLHYGYAPVDPKVTVLKPLAKALRQSFSPSIKNTDACGSFLYDTRLAILNGQRLLFLKT